MFGSSVIIQQIINGISLGAMYSLIAVGFTLFFGMINLINLAHGEIFMLGAFIALITIGTLAGSGLLTSSLLLLLIGIFLITMVVAGLIGAGIERVVIRPLQGGSQLMTLLVTLGVSIVLREGVMLFYPNGANPQSFPGLIPSGSIELGGALIRYQQLFLLGVSLTTIFLFYLFINKTEYGRLMRATAQDREAALMMGVDIDKVIMLTFMVGSALGAMGGILNGMYYSIIRFNMGFVIGIKGFSAAVVGGLGNIYGAVVGGFLLGFLEMSTAAFIPGGSRYQDVIGFLIVIFFLAFKPSGIFGEKAYEKV